MIRFNWTIWSLLALSLGAALAVAACRRPTPPPAAASAPAAGSRTSAAAPSAAAELLRFERTACYGPCPVDVLVVLADGRLRYEGREHAPRRGRFGGQLTGPEQAALVQAFEEARFFEFAAAYKSRATDLPTYYLTFSRGGRSHKVADYDGAPAALKALEDRLEALIDAPRWQPE